ncbi:MAG TPA: ferritin-like domain-containing protein [Pyrinomonadaceae bacterium]|nr:ferritin-like domain-containing protein [Pyrinomonadaceae bacterium]
MSSSFSDIKTLRKNARSEIQDGAVTLDYALDKDEAVKVLNEALATEIVCVLRYRFHYFMASGIHKDGAATEFLEHSNEELRHADMIAERIKQLGGKPEMNPASVTDRSHAEYVEGNSLEDMLKEDLVAERIAIQSYREMVKFFGTADPTSRRLMEEILAVEEEHADDIADLLFAAQPDNVENVTKLYAPDEVPGKSDAGRAVKSENA